MSEALSTPTAREPQRRGAPGLTWAIILISIGAIALLNNLKIINIYWLDLLQFWPVILILIGLDVLFGRRSLFGSLATAAVALVVVGGIVWFFGVLGTRLPNSASIVTEKFSKELGSAESVDANLKLGVGETALKALSGGKNVAEGTYTTNSSLKVSVAYETSGKTGNLTIAQSGSDKNINTLNNFVGDLNMSLTDAVPVDLTVEAGVGRITLDLTGINLRSLTVKGGVGSIDIILPDTGDFPVKVDVGVGSIDIRVSKTMAARVDYDGGLSSIDVPSRFNSAGKDQWETSDYDGAANRVLFQIKAGIGSVNITD